MKEITKKGWRPLLVLLLLFIIWELIVNYLEVPRWLLPSPTNIISETISGWENFLPHLLSTIKLALLGFFIGSAIGLITAIILHLLPIVSESVYPLLILS